MSIDDKLEEVDRKECVSAMYQALKIFSKEQQKLVDGKNKVLNFLSEAQTYEDIGFNVKYFYSEKTKGYTFSYEEKEEAGFRKWLMKDLCIIMIN